MTIIKTTLHGKKFYINSVTRDKGGWYPVLTTLKTEALRFKDPAEAESINAFAGINGEVISDKKEVANG